MLLLVILLIVASPFVAMLPLWLGQPPRVVIARHYVAEYNARIAKIPEGERAWRLYIRVAAELEDVPEELADGWPASPADAHWDAAAAYLERNARALELIRDAAHRPHLGMALSDVVDPEYIRVLTERTGKQVEQGKPGDTPGLGDIVQPNLDLARRFVDVLVADARAAATDGDTDRFMDDVGAVIGLAEQTREQPFTEAFLAGLSILERACREVLVVLTDRPNLLSSEQLMQASSRLSAHAGGDLSPPIEYPKIAFLDLVQRAYTDDGKGDGRVTRDGAEMIARAVDPTGSPRPDDIVRIQEQAASRVELMAEFESTSSALEKTRTSPWWSDGGRAAARAIELRIGQPGGRDRFAPIVRFGNEAVLMRNESERVIQIRDATRTAIALELYRRTHGSYPAALDQLVPEFLDEVPPDRADGQPLRYERTDDGATLYSIDGSWRSNEAPAERWVLFPPESNNK